MAGQTRRRSRCGGNRGLCSFPVFSSVGVANADACLTAPGAAGPKGSRWYYRIEWPSQRKCWHLVQKDKRPATAAKAAPQPDTDDDTEAAPTPAPTAGATVRAQRSARGEAGTDAARSGVDHAQREQHRRGALAAGYACRGGSAGGGRAPAGATAPRAVLRPGRCRLPRNLPRHATP